MRSLCPLHCRQSSFKSLFRWFKTSCNPQKLPPTSKKDTDDIHHDGDIWHKSYPTFKTPEAGILWSIYRRAKIMSDRTPLPGGVNPKAVFCNNILDLSQIGAWGFDYDYTLAIYTMELNKFIYWEALVRLVAQRKYPAALLDIPYDPKFVIRGLHYDVHNGTLLKLDATLQIQYGTVYRGKMALSDDEVDDIYGGDSVPKDCLDPDVTGMRPMHQLTDLFSMPEAGLLVTIVDYMENRKLGYNPLGLFKDVQGAVRDVHLSGDLYAAVTRDLEKYLHKNPGLPDFLNRLSNAKKTLFLITNSPFDFINRGMSFLVSPDWRDLFDLIIVQAGKPDFFQQTKTPFREFNMADGCMSWQKIAPQLERGKVYGEGNIYDLAEQETLKGKAKKGVLYLGDHIYSDLADPTLTHGWHTGAIVAELESEVKRQNSADFTYCVQWTQVLNAMIEMYQDTARTSPETLEILNMWLQERKQYQERIKSLFNPHFGSIFRNFHNPSQFMRRLSRLADVYTSRLPNLLDYSLDHCFIPRRSPLAHENFYSIVPEELGLVRFVDRKKIGNGQHILGSEK